MPLENGGIRKAAPAEKDGLGHGQQQARHPRRQTQQQQQQQPSHTRCYPLVAMPGPSTKEVLAFFRKHHGGGDGGNEKCEDEDSNDAPGEMLGNGEGAGGEEGQQQMLAEDLSDLVHEQMERADAELLLGACPLGTHLLRRRPDRSLALSLKASEGVLHIKLQFRAGQWVLGEGPRFRHVHSMLRAYRRCELPVRGAEHVRLGALLRPDDVPSGGLLLL